MNIEEIWSQYRNDIKAFLHSKVSNPEDVEELLQEILIRTYQNLNTLKSQEKARAWLFTIARNIIIDFYRKNGKSGDIQSEDLWYLDREAEKEHIFSNCVQPLINDLPDDAAKLLIAIDLDGQSQKEYAKNIGVSYSTLKSRVQSARNKLYQLFHEYCDISVDRRGNIIEYKDKTGRYGNYYPKPHSQCSEALD